MFPFTALAVKDKASKQNRLHCYKRRNFLEQRINATRGGEYSGKRQDNPAAATRSPKRRRARKWGKSNKPLFLYFSFITCLSAIAESIHNGKVSRLACSPIRKGITFTHFLCQKKSSSEMKMCLGVKKFLTNPWVIEVPGKEAFLCPCQIYLARSQICSWGTSKQAEPDNKYDPLKLLLFVLLNVVTFTSAFKYYLQN